MLSAPKESNANKVMDGFCYAREAIIYTTIKSTLFAVSKDKWNI